MAGPLNSKQIPVIWVWPYGILQCVTCQHGLFSLSTLKFDRLESVLQMPSYLLVLCAGWSLFSESNSTVLLSMLPGPGGWHWPTMVNTVHAPDLFLPPEWL